jgi:hypothetical protein
VDRCRIGFERSIVEACAVCYVMDARRLPETDGRKLGSNAQSRVFVAGHRCESKDSTGALAISEGFRVVDCQCSVWPERRGDWVHISCSSLSNIIYLL